MFLTIRTIRILYVRWMGSWSHFFIEEYRYKTDTVILLKLKNVDDEKAAREFSNREVFYSLDEVDRDDLVGDMTWDSFIGYRVIDEHHGENWRDY